MKTPSGWHDQLSWAIRPDCVREARDVLLKVATEAGGGLHRENIMKAWSKDVASWLGLDELPIDMIDSQIAVVTVDGVMVNLWNPLTANYPMLTAAFQRCLEDPKIKAVIVRLKTPGGTVSGLQECGAILNQLSDAKLTVAQVDGGCYSAGYYLASFCGEIRCGETDMLGNIGCVTNILDWSEAFRQEGIKSITLRTGPIKGIGIMGDPVTDIQQQFLAQINQAHFEYFKAAVMNGRGMDEDQFDTIADGRWWLGSQALELGVIDAVSSMAETVDAVRKYCASLTLKGS